MTEPEFTSETLARRVAERRELEADLERAQAPLREYLRNVTLTNLETGERTELDGVATIALDPVTTWQDVERELSFCEYVRPDLPGPWTARVVNVARAQGLLSAGEDHRWG